MYRVSYAIYYDDGFGFRVGFGLEVRYQETYSPKEQSNLWFKFFSIWLFTWTLDIRYTKVKFELRYREKSPLPIIVLDLTSSCGNPARFYRVESLLLCKLCL